MSEKLSVSVVIHTYNEEKNIRNCLESVKWAEEILVCDMYSEDRTVEIAREYTDRIIFFERVGYVEPARQYAVSQTKNEWVLIVDADELVPYKMYKKIKDIVENDRCDVAYFPRNNYFFGKLLMGNGWGALQDIHPRLFKKSFMELSPAVHAIFKIKPGARVLYVSEPEEGFIHFNYIDVEHFIDKLNRYTTIEAKNMFDSLKPAPGSFMKELYVILKHFAGRFFILRGYKDGKIGFYLALLMGAYHATAFLKYILMKRFKNKDTKSEVLRIYEKIAENIISEYKNETKS